MSTTDSINKVLASNLLLKRKTFKSKKVISGLQKIVSRAFL